MAIRSLLYVPGDRPERFAKAATAGADGIILDLEDAVAPGSKASARESIREWLATDEAALCPVWVRVNNHPDLLADDVAAIVSPRVVGIAVPKVETAQVLNDVIAGFGAPVALAPLLETARGVLNVLEIASGTQVSHLMIGEADLGAELAITDPEGFWPIRTQIVLASAAAGIGAPVGPVSLALKDADLLRATSAVLRGRGFGGRSCIHPDQVSVVNEVFTRRRRNLSRLATSSSASRRPSPKAQACVSTPAVA